MTKSNGTEFVVALTTTDSQETARIIAKTLVRERLVACVNTIAGVESVYEWKGEIRHETECLLLMKTRETCVAQLQRRLTTLHPYECPELVILPITEGLEAYLTWIQENTT